MERSALFSVSSLSSSRRNDSTLSDHGRSAGLAAESLPPFASAAIFGIAGAIALLHILTNGRYGFHRDELQFLSDARHLDWGFVAYPPFTPFVERVSMGIFGMSMVWLRMASVIAQAVAIVVTGMMAWELGGGLLAQGAAALGVALSPLPIFEGTEFQYTTFDYLWWVLIAYFVIRLLKTGGHNDDPRWCVAIGATIGVGFMTKYAIGFYVAGIVGGLVLTQARKFLASKWFWIGIALAIVICLPNVIWQARHDWISWHFLQHIHKRDVGEGRAEGFIPRQFWLCTNAFSVPLWVAGLICYFRERRYRMLAWMYVIPFALFFFGKGRDYYLAAAYPMLIAMGAAVGEKWVGSLGRGWRWAIEGVMFTGIVVYGLLLSAILVPYASSGPLRYFALKNNGDLREEFGWHELTKAVADIRDSLPPDQQAHAGVIVGNYGEGGALELYGPAYHLPPVIMLTNTGWLRGYPTPAPSTLIVVGWSQTQVIDAFTSCRLAGHNGNPYGIENEESRYHPDIYVCGPPKQSWPEFWKEHQRFG